MLKMSFKTSLAMLSLWNIIIIFWSGKFANYIYIYLFFFIGSRNWNAYPQKTVLL